jgi:taurine dioxygenase
MTDALRVSPLQASLPYGARVGGVTEAILQDEATRRQLRALFQDRGLLVFEDVEPSNDMQLAISRVFGSIKDYAADVRGAAAPAGALGVKEMAADPATCTIVEIDGEPLSSWLPWHFDQCYLRAPNRARVLRCPRAAPSGGLTGFLDGVALYAAIAPAIRERLEGSSVLYEMDMHLAHLRFGVPERFRVIREAPKFSLEPGARPALPRASHPAVIACPPGRKALHVSPWMAVGLLGVDGEVDPRGDDLLEALSQDLARLSGSIAYYHSWRPTDMLLWDNRRMLHSATGCDPASTRIMCRATITDDRAESGGQPGGQ